MPQRISYALFSASGTPLLGASPVFLSYRKVTGEVLVPPTAAELGGGFYEFLAYPEVDGPSGYLIDAGPLSSARYLAGACGACVAFAMYDASGSPDAARSPAFATWTDYSSSVPAAPAISNLGGGLYGFPVPSYPARLVRYVAGDSLNQYWGTLGGTAAANYVPAPGSGIGATQVLSFDVLDSESELGRVLVAVRYAGLGGATELAWDGDAPVGPHLVAWVSIPGGRRYFVLRKGGWPSSPTVRVFVTNFGGREV